jgi:hypothetical protein
MVFDFRSKFFVVLTSKVNFFVMVFLCFTFQEVTSLGQAVKEESADSQVRVSNILGKV